MQLPYPIMKRVSSTLLGFTLGGVFAFAQPAPQTPASASTPASVAPTAAPAKPSPPTPRERPAEGPALFTEDFESGAIKPEIWTSYAKGAATLRVQSEKVAHGKFALHAHYPAGTVGSGAWNFIGAALPASLRDRLYGRVYIYATGVPLRAHNVFLLAGSKGFPIADFLEIGANQHALGTVMASFQLNDPKPPERRRSETVRRGGEFPLDRWACIEWEFTETPETRLVIWVDGKLAVNETITHRPLDNATSNLTGGFVEFVLGYRNWAGANTNAQPIDIYYDDLAIGDKPIGPLAPVR